MGEPGNGTLFGLLPQNLLYSIAYMHVVVEVGVEAIAPACFVAWLVRCRLERKAWEPYTLCRFCCLRPTTAHTRKTGNADLTPICMVRLPLYHIVWYSGTGYIHTLGIYRCSSLTCVLICGSFKQARTSVYKRFYVFYNVHPPTNNASALSRRRESDAKIRISRVQTKIYLGLPSESI